LTTEENRIIMRVTEQKRIKNTPNEIRFSSVSV